MEEEYVTIWRVENAYGCGPYAQSGQGNIHTTLHEVDGGRYVKRHFPEEDISLMRVFNLCNHGDYIFGFESLDKYREWFDGPDIAGVLARSGFTLNRYRVPESDVVFGERQAMFRREKAILQEKCSPLPEGGGRELQFCHS